MDLGLGNYAASPELFEFILKNIPFGKSILEFGSGTGTHLLGQFYKMHSIEHDRKFIGLTDRSSYIYAPLTDHTHARFPHHKQWYDVDIIMDYVKDINYDVILVDGPPGHVGRAGFLSHMDLFEFDGKMLILDDVDRDDEFRMFIEIQMTFHQHPNFFSCILPGTAKRVDGTPADKKFAVFFFGKNAPTSLQIPHIWDTE